MLKHNACLTCNEVLWGDRALNDHTKQCREKKVTKNQKQKPTTKVNINRNKPTNIYTLMDELNLHIKYFKGVPYSS